MSKKSLDQCREGKDFIEYAETHGAAQVRNGKGDHFVVYGPKGQVVVPACHELGKGLRHKVIKTMIAIGISASVYFFFYVLPTIGGV